MSATRHATAWWHRVAARLRARRAREAAAHSLYASLVGQARQPVLFAELGVPDTREGRLEMVLVHAILVLRRLQAEGEDGRALGQQLFDLMFADIDRHLREWGVGDLSVGKHVKRVAQTFYARAAALEPGLADGDAAALVPVLSRNVYGSEAADPHAVAALARYLLAQQGVLYGQGRGMLQGNVTFGPAPAPATGGREPGPALPAD